MRCSSEIALGFLLQVEPILAVFAMCMMIAGGLVVLERQRLVSLDALLGVLAHAVFAAGLVVIAFMERLRVDLIGYLFGDILSVGVVDLWLIFATAAVATARACLAVAQPPLDNRQPGSGRGGRECPWNGCASCSCSCSPR